ncbi:MAG: DNA primase [Firmicutes bacterium]|nr:DNA primase [Bacillota bacterium]MBT9158241.1 DNA primase [Bacillota bacterium]
MPSYPREFVERVRSSADILQVVGEQVRLTKKGRNFWGLCPFHGEKTPSFSVSQEKQMYYCFGCQAGGNALSFLMEHNKMSFHEAVEKLAERVGLELPTNQIDDQELLVRRRERERSLKVMEWATATYQRQLQNDSLGREAREYLSKRGLSTDLVAALSLGYSLPPWRTLLERAEKDGYTPQELLQSGLAVQGEKGPYDRFRHRLMFPIRNRQGQVIAFGGRVLDDSQPKYLNSPETALFHKGQELFGLDRAGKVITKAGYAVVVEGYMDALTAWQHGIDNVVASLGTALTTEQVTILKRYTNYVTLCYDADEAGQAATLRAIEVLRRLGMQGGVAVLGGSKDPDDYLRVHGKDDFLQSVTTAALPFIEYRIEQLAQGADQNTPASRGLFAASVAKLLAEVENAVEREGYLDRAMLKYHLPRESFRQELSKALGRPATTDKLSKQRHNISGKEIVLPKAGWLKAARTLMYLMATQPGERVSIYHRWRDLGFCEERHRQLATWMAEDLTLAEDPVALAHELSVDLKSELLVALSEQTLEENTISMANECFIAIEEHNLSLEIVRIDSAIEAAVSLEERNSWLKERTATVLRKKKLR